MSSTWYNKDQFKDIPRNELLRLVAKTSTITDHTNDVSLPVEQRRKRVVSPEELMLGARSLIQRPVLINHNMNMVKGVALDAEYIRDLEQIECIVRVPPEIVAAYNAGVFSQCSVGYGERELKVEGDTEYPIGFWIGEVSLIIGNSDNIKAGDPNAVVHSFEFKIEAVKIDDVPPEPKETPKIVEPETPKIIEPEEPKIDYEKKYKDLEGAYAKVVKETESNVDKVRKAKLEGIAEGKKEVINKVSTVLPSLMIMRTSNSGMNLLAQKIKKALKEVDE